MAHTYYKNYAVYPKRSNRGTLAIPEMQVYNGVAAAYASPNGPGAIVRFGHKGEGVALTAGMAFSSTNSEQFLAFDDGSTLYKCRVANHMLADFTHEYEGLKPGIGRTYLVDTVESGTLAAADSVTAYRWSPGWPESIALDMVGLPAAMYYQAYGVHQWFLEPIYGTIVNNTGDLFVPSTLFKPALESGDATEVTDYTKTATSAMIELDDGATVFSAYATTTGNSAYMIFVIDATNSLAIWGYIRAIATGGGTAWNIDIYNDAAGTAQTWNGNATDIAVDAKTDTTAWYIYAVGSDNPYVGETAYKADDPTDITGDVVLMDNENSGILQLTTGGTVDDALSLWYSEYEQYKVPSAAQGSTWASGDDLDLRKPINTLALVAKGSGVPIIGGNFVHD